MLIYFPSLVYACHHNDVITSRQDKTRQDYIYTHVFECWCLFAFLSCSFCWKFVLVRFLYSQLNLGPGSSKTELALNTLQKNEISNQIITTKEPINIQYINCNIFSILVERKVERKEATRLYGKWAVEKIPENYKEFKASTRLPSVVKPISKQHSFESTTSKMAFSKECNLTCMSSASISVFFFL
jgi:hypothetical protein